MIYDPSTEGALLKLGTWSPLLGVLGILAVQALVSVAIIRYFLTVREGGLPLVDHAGRAGDRLRSPWRSPAYCSSSTAATWPAPPTPSTSSSCPGSSLAVFVIGIGAGRSTSAAAHPERYARIGQFELERLASRPRDRTDRHRQEPSMTAVEDPAVTDRIGASPRTADRATRSPPRRLLRAERRASARPRAVRLRHAERAAQGRAAGLVARGRAAAARGAPRRCTSGASAPRTRRWSRSPTSRWCPGAASRACRRRSWPRSSSPARRSCRPTRAGRRPCASAASRTSRSRWSTRGRRAGPARTTTPPTAASRGR